jgi:protein-tyrosine kinase
MGSMSKVMQKLRDQGGGENAAPDPDAEQQVLDEIAAEAAAEASAAESPTTPDAPVPATDEAPAMDTPPAADVTDADGAGASDSSAFTAEAADEPASEAPTMSEDGAPEQEQAVAATEIDVVNDFDAPADTAPDERDAFADADTDDLEGGELDAGHLDGGDADDAQPVDESIAAAQPADDWAAVDETETEGDVGVVDNAPDGASDASPAATPVEENRAASAPNRDDLDVLPDDESPAAIGGDITVQWEADRVDPVVVAFHDRYSAICEQFRAVRARLLAMNSGNVPLVLAVTSSIPEEGKSVSTINLGLVMAEGGDKRILITDADFRRMSVARMLGIEDGPGLAEILRGEAELGDAIQDSPFPNLKILPAGHVRDNAYADLLGSANTAALVGAICRERFDYAFIDTPPITTVSDVSLLAPQCDGALMVIQMRRTPEPTVQQAVRTLQANNVKLMGCLLSRYRERSSGYYEQYYYSSYYYKR